MTLLLTVLLACAAPPAVAPPPPTPQVVVVPVPWLAPEVAQAPPGWLAATEVRVSWRDAQGAPADVTRTQAEAAELAESLWRRAHDGEPLATLVHAASDAPSGRRDGAMGTFRTGTLAAPIEAALAATPVGELAPLVRTDAGIHLLRRDPAQVRRVTWAAFGHDASHPPHRGRSAQVARAAAEAWVDAVRAGEPPSGPAPDAVSDAEGVWLGPQTWSPTLTGAVWALDVGEVTVVEAPNGVLVVRRAEGP